MEQIKKIAVWSLSLVAMLTSLIVFTMPFLNAHAAKVKPNFKNVIIFGDSLSDAGNPNGPNELKNGNNIWVRVKDKVGAPITNMDVDRDQHLLWVNYFMEDFFDGQSIYPASHVKLLKLDPTKESIDYAWASAESGFRYINDTEYPPPLYYPYNDAQCMTHGPGHINNLSACVPSVERQIQFYLADVKNQPSPDTLFIIWAGGNDIFNNTGKLLTSSETAKDNVAKWLKSLLSHLSISPSWNASPTWEHLSRPISNILSAKDMLIRAGVSREQIYVIDLPDLSKTPAANNKTNGNPFILGILKIVTSAFNTNLRLALSYNVFNKMNLPASHIYSANSLFKKIINNPLKYGFTNVKDSCVDNKKLPYCLGYLFFDDKHPTTMAGKLMGQELADYIKTQNLTHHSH